MANILVVDDERDVLEALGRALKFAGHNVTKATTATEAISVAGDHSFDLVVLDYIMPSMSGIALLNKIRELQPTIRSIIVSGKIDSQLSEEAIVEELRDSIEADSYLHKPLDNTKLLEIIRRLLEQTQERDWKQVAGLNLRAKKRDAAVKSAERSLRRHRAPKRK